MNGGLLYWRLRKTCQARLGNGRLLLQGTRFWGTWWGAPFLGLSYLEEIYEVLERYAKCPVNGSLSLSLSLSLYWGPVEELGRGPFFGIF